MNILESDRLIFRLMEPGDEDALYDIWGDPETMRFCGGAVKRERIQKIIAYDKGQYEKYGNAVFALVLRENGALTGICGGKLGDDGPLRAEAIVHLNKNAWGKGYAIEAMKAYISWLKEAKKAALVCASAHPDNAASINMLKKCGFIQKGFKRYEDTDFADEPYFELEL
jgi:ribosomal-protein-alanine N-acetyltransferase